MDINTTNLTIETSLQIITDTLLQSANNAYSECFKENSNNHFTKKWWTPEITRNKSLLTIHFNLWKEEGFIKDPTNYVYNRYLLARRNFRQSVKNAENKKIHKKYIDINGLKNTHPRNFWKNIRKLKKTKAHRP